MPWLKCLTRHKIKPHLIILVCNEQRFTLLCILKTLSKLILIPTTSPTLALILSISHITPYSIAESEMLLKMPLIFHCCYRSHLCRAVNTDSRELMGVCGEGKGAGFASNSVHGAQRVTCSVHNGLVWFLKTGSKYLANQYSKCIGLLVPG